MVITTEGRTGWVGMLLVSAVLSSLAACAAKDVGIELLGQCGGDRRFQVLELDDSPTQAAPELVAEKIVIVRSLATQTSEHCGRLRVETFRGSRTDSTVLLDRDLTPEGRTDSARDRNRGALVNEVVATVAAKLKPGADGGSAPLAALAHGRDMLRQTKATKSFLFVATDGIETEAVNLATGRLSTATASEFFDEARAAVPELKGVSVVISGIGRVNGRQPPSSYTDGLLSFWNLVCAKAQAVECTVLDQLAIPTQQGGIS